MEWSELLGVEPAREADELDRLFLRVFSTQDGVKLLAHLRAVTIEQPTWYPGEDASHGYAREGQNSLVRDIERRINRARSEHD